MFVWPLQGTVPTVLYSMGYLVTAAMAASAGPESFGASVSIPKSTPTVTSRAPDVLIQVQPEQNALKIPYQQSSSSKWRSMLGPGFFLFFHCTSSVMLMTLSAFWSSR